MRQQNSQSVHSEVKNQELVKLKRTKIVEVATNLFLEKGFHKTSTREITAAAGISTGSLYSYVKSKEGVLLLVCEAIHAEIELKLQEVIKKNNLGFEELNELIKEYFMLCDSYGDHILLIYQETRSLSSKFLKKVLSNEVRISDLFIKVINNIVKTEKLVTFDEPSIELIAHNIVVLGHMWAFRKWFLALHYNIEEYIDIQTKFIRGFLGRKTQGSPLPIK